MTQSSYSKLAPGTPFSCLATRREFLCLFALAGTHASPELTIPEALKTSHKYNRLVVAASNKVGEFDAQFADAPFVFRHGQSFYMTYIGFDGEGYQTGLASSSDPWTRP
jgi:hypothetical protein